MSLQLGIQLSPGNTTWEALRDHGLLVERLGYDWLWTADHLMSSGDTTLPYLDGWQILPAWAALTSRVRIGMLVTAVTFRHPAVLAKMVGTLDHISDGRAILGLGAAWYEEEHTSYGIAFGTPGERLEKLDEAATIVRGLLDQPRTTLAGKHYRLRGAIAEPKPIQRRLPLMIGGSRIRMLRLVAKHADMWNSFGSPGEMARKLEMLTRHCADLRRDPASIFCTVTVRPIVRDSADEIEAQFERYRTHNRQEKADRSFALVGDSEACARRFAEYWRLGIRGVIMQMRAPYDRETIERIAMEVRPRTEELIASEATAATT
jgi:alkanesulfonate monooxygenase SsuD/methylene tetrahydromethanopterin reductase-like flavin-dependent oxidoreductase (luciferase family)